MCGSKDFRVVIVKVFGHCDVVGIVKLVRVVFIIYVTLTTVTHLVRLTDSTAAVSHASSVL